jgi:hypothetical protein
MRKKENKQHNFGVFLGKSVLSVDRFSTPIQLNVNGNTEVKSVLGTILTILLLIALGGYAFQMI